MTDEPLDEWGRQPKAVAARMRALADKIEDRSLGHLTLQDLGTVFGNEFWLLVLFNAGQPHVEPLRFKDNELKKMWDIETPAGAFFVRMAQTVRALSGGNL